MDIRAGVRGKEMKTLLILGAGQYGRVAKEVAQSMGEFDKIQFLDDGNACAVGKLCDVEKLPYDAAFVAIGNVEVRKYWLGRLDKIATLIHPKATVMPSAKMGEGCILEAGAVVCSGAVVGRGTIIMANAVVGHDAKVGDCCQLKYNVSVAERACVPDGTKIEPNQTYGI